MRVLLLGSTGSIGVQTLEVLAALNAMSARGRRAVRYEVVGLAAGARGGALEAQAGAWSCPRTALREGPPPPGLGGSCRVGEDAALRLVEETDADLVVAAMVGVAGLRPTLAALEAGRHVAIANKETLVAAGSLMVAAARRTGARLLPVDSEHAASWQCLKSLAGTGYCPPSPAPASLSRLILTASGGAFRDRTRDEIADASLQAALAHPNWSMGAKVTIDSATLTNKALELVEAHWLFGLPADRLGVLIHRQSAVHALAESVDRGLIAHLAAPDMRLPIQAAITAPDCVESTGTPALDLARLGRLDFEAPDHARFPVLDVARRVIEAGGTAGAVFNAANEAAVAAFVEGRLPFGRIDLVTRDVVEAHAPAPATSLDDVFEADAWARAEADRRIAR